MKTLTYYKNNLHALDESHLLTCIAEGDESAFEHLYAQYFIILKQLLKKYASTETETQEIIQDTFMKVWLNRDELPKIQNFKAWIYKVASREYLFKLRTKLNYEKRINGYSAQAGLTKQAETPLDVVSYTEVRSIIVKTLAKLPPQRQKIYEMNRLEGLSIGEIAEKLGLSPQTVKNTLQTASKTIRQELIANGFGPFLHLIIFYFFSKH